MRPPEEAGKGWRQLGRWVLGIVQGRLFGGLLPGSPPIALRAVAQRAAAALAARCSPALCTAPMSQQVFAALLYAYTPECFPTAARNTGAGLAYGVGRLANAFGPLFVAWLFTSYGYTSVFEYIAVCWAMVAILVTLFGPKTRGRALA